MTDGVDEIEAVADWLRVCVPLAVPERLGVPDTLGDEVADALWVLLGDCVELGERVELWVSVSDAV